MRLQFILFCVVHLIVLSQGRIVHFSIGASANFTTIKDAYNAALSVVKGDVDYTEVTLELSSGEVFTGINNMNLDLSNFTYNKLIIRGEDDLSRVAWDCSSSGRAFFVVRPSMPSNANFTEIVLENLEIRNCYPSNTTTTNPIKMSGGGAIHVFSNYTRMTIRNCDFHDNKALETDGSGGAIYLVGPNSIRNMMAYNMTGGPIYLTVESSRFTNNQAVNGDGGAIGVMNAVLYFNNTSFYDNLAYRGGAISEENSNIGNINAEDYYYSCTFQNNTGTIGSGGVRIRGWEATFTRCNFFNIKSRNYGALFVFQSAVVCQTCNFTRNTNFGSGGAVSIVSGGMDAYDSVFNNNYAYGAGGAIHVEGTASVEVINGKVTGNTGLNGGGGLSIQAGAKGNVSNTVISGNIAPNGGGVYLQYGSKLFLTDSQITGNTVTRTGGGIYCSDSTVNIDSKSTVDSNTNGDLECANEVPGTYCKVEGDSSFNGQCKAIDTKSGLRPEEKTIIGLVVGIFGMIIVVFIVGFIIYFADPTHRRQQGMYFSFLDGKEQQDSELGQQKLDDDN